jgi:FkbM family methyltransferase
MKSLGGTPAEIDLAPFLDTARLLYGGPWVAERYLAIRDFFDAQPDTVFPPVREIIAGGRDIGAADTFAHLYKLRAFKRVCDAVWNGIDVMLTPTAGTIYRVDDMQADPIRLNANLGYYTLLMADAVGPSGSVIAFEPNPRLANMARTSVGINDFGSRVTIREEAVGHTAGGQLTLAIPRANPQNALIMQSEEQKQGFKNVHGDYAQFVQVKSITLDSLNLTNVGMVKIDAEGAEYNIWRGMQSTIDNNPGIQICLEFNASRGYPWEQFLNEMQGKFKQVSHVDYDGQIKPLTTEMIKTQRTNEDWMIYLARG